MIYKQCCRCKDLQLIINFGKDKSTKDEYKSACKKCRKQEYSEYVKKYPKRLKETQRKSSKKYREKNIIAMRKKDIKNSKAYREKNPEKIKKYLKKNKEKIKKQKHEWYVNNKIYENNKETIKIKSKTNHYKRLKKDLNYKLQCYSRSRIFNAIKHNSKSASTIKLLNCTINELKQHLESQFDSNMTWNNYGSYWSIDHIIPCSLYDFKKKHEQRKCFNYKNLRPLEKIENINKSHNLNINLIDQYNILHLLPNKKAVN